MRAGHAAATCSEQLQAEMILERSDLAADGTLCDGQFLGGPAEVSETGTGFEHAHRVEGREPSHFSNYEFLS